MSEELADLQKQWQKKTNEPMPRWIEVLSLRQIKLAVATIEAGGIVCEPRESVTAGVPRTTDSIRDWDKDSEF